MVSQKKILVVEDNLINRMMLREILASEYNVLEAENGQEALEVLKVHGEGISLILLDIIMPVMDGYTFLSHIKADSVYSSIPVIVTTQSENEADEVTALSNGAADFVAKPYKPQVILHRVASIIHLRETAAMMNLIQYDRLTGLYGKEFFYQRVKEILLQNPDKEYDIICSDIVNFKLVNDIFGIPAGDHLLCRVAEQYQKAVGTTGICSRFNADQFACLLDHREYTDEVFIRAAAEVNALSNVKNVVIKWGIYTIRDRELTVEQMCDRAMLAAHSIKGQYSKYFAKYDDELRSRLLWEQAVTDGMEPALAEGQFEIYLQPKYRIMDNGLSGAEALVRWKHPEWGLQPPAQFIPLFERNGFITKLDQYVWDQACAVLREWDDKGYPLISISVNVSRADIYNADIADILMKTIQKYGLPPSRLHLEITESAYTEDPKQIIDTATHLRELGFVIELDDFGSGYSSLNMLHKMPVDILKLDMKFIQSETAKPVSQGILRFIMELARWMNLSVVAEGVETGEQLERLRETGCDYVQGYYFAKPLPVKDFETLVKMRGINTAGAWESTIQNAASRDYLTGLLNRQGLLSAAASLRKEDAPYAVYLFDLDNLKHMNRTVGHTEGDRLLIQFAELLHLHTRGSDILARFGGDEFIAVMKQMRSEKNAIKKGEEIVMELQKIHFLENTQASCSVGIAIGGIEDTIQDVIKLAEQALKHAKADGRGGCCLWNSDVSMSCNEAGTGRDLADK